MSEDAKMGLFGSKDENNESTSDEKKVSTQTQENSPERYAPYSVDSDSETYDTEALSMMDINDIIGVQADAPGDSTLESEFAALSEIITDSKDEISSEIGNSIVNKEGAGKSDEAMLKKTPKDFTNEGMTSISKSLQLIGEAYISDDSQETDIEESEESNVKKPSSFAESFRPSNDPEEDKKVIEKHPSTKITSPAVENVEPEKIITEVKNHPKIELPIKEITEKSLQPSDITGIKKSVDFTDSAGSNDPKQPSVNSNLSECMDVDSQPTREIEKFPIESQTLEQVEESKEDTEKIINEGDKKSPIVKVDNSTIDPAETEEPMDVDEIFSTIVPEVKFPVTAKNDTEIYKKESNLIKIEKSTIINKVIDIKPGETKKFLEKESGQFIEPPFESKTVEEEPILSLREVKSLEDNSNPECSKSPKKDPISTEHKIVIKRDELLKGSTMEKVVSEIPSYPIEKSIEEKTTQDDETIFPSDKEEFDLETSPTGGKKFEKIIKEVLLEEREETVEPMEIVENTEPAESEKNEPEISEYSGEIPESVSKVPSKYETQNKEVEKLPEITTKSSEVTEIDEKESLAVSTSEENLNEKFVPIRVETSKRCSEIVAAVPVKALEDISLEGSSQQSDEVSEDEKMEVDASAKEKKHKESTICQEDESLLEVEKTSLFVTQEENVEDKMKEKCGIDTVDIAVIHPDSPEVAQIEEICTKFDDVTADISTESHENVDEENSVLAPSGGTRQENEEETKIDEPESKKEGEISLIQSETEESREFKDTTIPDKVLEKREKKDEIESIISSGGFQSSVEVEEKIEELEKMKLQENEMSKKVESEKEETEMVKGRKEASIFKENTKYSEKIREIENVQSEEIVDSMEFEKMEEESEIVKEEKEVAISNEPGSLIDESHEIEDSKLGEKTVKDSKENEELETESASNEEKKENSEEGTEFSNEEEKETLISIAQIECSNEEAKETTVVMDKDETLTEEQQENLIPSRNVKSLIEEENEIRISIENVKGGAFSEGIMECSSSIEKVEPSNEDKKETLISAGNVESLIEQESEIQMSTVNVETSSEEAIETSILIENVEFSNEEENETLMSTGNVESSNEEEKETLISTENVAFSDEEDNEPLISTRNLESSNDEENLIFVSYEKVETSIAKLQKIQTAQSSQEIPENLESDKNEANEEIEPSTSLKDSIDFQSPTKSSIEREEVIFSKPDVPESTITDDIENEEDQVEEEMNLSLDPEILESPLSPSEDNRTSGLSPERMMTEPEDEIEDHVEMNLSLDPEEKDDICPDESSMEKPEEADEERIEKCGQDSSENMKDILSTGNIHVTEMFHDDEQSQSTQEMMESILETDKGNINKILDDEEAESAEIDEIAKKLPNDSDELLNKALEDPMTSQNIDSLEGLLDLDLMPENDEPSLKAVAPIVEKVMKESEDIESLGKQVDVSLLMEGNDRSEDLDQSDAFNARIVDEIVENDAEEIAPSVDDSVNESAIETNSDAKLEATSGLTENDLEAFELASVGADPMENVDASEETKIDLTEDLLREITVDEERKMELEENILLASSIREEGKNDLNRKLLLENFEECKNDLIQELLLENTCEEEKDELTQEFLLDYSVEEEKVKLPQEILLENTVEDENIALKQELLIGNFVEEEKVKSTQELLLENTVEEKNYMSRELLLENVIEEEKMEFTEAILENAAEDGKIDLPQELLIKNAIEEEKGKLTQELLLKNAVEEENLKLTEEILPENFNDKKIVFPEDLMLSSSSIQDQSKIVIPDEVFLEDPVVTEANLELPEDISLSITVRDQVLSDVAVEIEDLPPTSEISELESAVKFLQESEEQDIDSPLVLSPKLVESVVDDIAQNSDVGIFATDSDICGDATELVAELEKIIPDPIAISEAEIINEAAKLESERKTKLSEETKLQSPISIKNESVESIFKITPPARNSPESSEVSKYPETPKTHRESREPREIISKPSEVVKIEHETLKKSVPIPKISILEERLKIPPKIEIPQGEVSRICDIPTTPKTSLLIQRDVKMSNYQKMLDSPKSGEKSELKIVDTPRKDSEKYDFENVGSPRIILKIAKSAIADCTEPRSPKSPKIRSATNSPNPDDSPGQKLGKIKLKLSKGGHPSIIPNDNVEELCGQWHTEGSSSLSPLGMKIKFSKIADSSPIAQTEKHEDDTREQPKHKFEEAKRTESPIGMKIKLSRTGDPSIVQQDAKEGTTKHKEKIDIIQQCSPKRTESPFGMKIKLSKSGDASIIQPDKQDSIEEHRDGNLRSKDKLEMPQHSERNDMPRRTESPLGMKFKLFKTGDASIVQSEASEDPQQENVTKRTDSPLGMKIKLSKSRASASIVSSEISEDMREKLEIPEVPRRTESPLGMKIKLSRTGDASIIHSEEPRESTKQKSEIISQETSQAEGSLGVKIKVGKSGDATIVQPEVPTEVEPVAHKRADPTIGMKIKLSKSGDASIVHPEREENIEESRVKSDNLLENIRKIDSSIGMKIKLSRSGDASIIQPQVTKKSDEQSVDIQETENLRSNEAPMAMKIKLQKSGECAIVESEKKEKSSRRKETEMPLEMKIKLSKTGHPTIIACENYGESSQRGKEISSENLTNKQKESPKENAGMKMLKSMHSASLHRSELTIEPVQSKKSEIVEESTAKRKEITISPVESKKGKFEAKLSHILPEVTIQPIKPREQKQMMFDQKKGLISRQQMNVISQEISITQVRSSKPIDLTMNDKIKSILAKKTTNTSTDCEIIEHRPELIIVNENSNSSQDVMIIEEVPAIRGPDVKIPKKRGRPRRNPLPLILAKPIQQGVDIVEPILQRDPLALDDVAQMPSHMVGPNFPTKDNETRGRPKRTCRSQKSYAPPRRGRGRGGRGKRKMDMEMELSKRPRIDQDLDMIERSTTALITIHEQPSEVSHSTSELYKALRQPTMDIKMPNAIARVEVEQAVNDPRNDPDQITKDHLESLMDARLKSHLDGVIGKSIEKSTNDETLIENENKSIIDTEFPSESEIFVNSVPGDMQKSNLSIGHDKIMEKTIDDAKDNKDSSNAIDHQNWLTPSSKKQLDGRNEGNMSNVQVMDEETRMSAESSSRSQTPARNLSVQASETIVNEESQGSVLSTATTESEKVKVKIRRMEISIDPDEGPFTVDKVAEYDWPIDLMKKSESFMIQEQISQFLGVKSFKRKYPDLKRRMVDMEERNFLRENGLVSEAMCDMGLTAVSSSEVLDVMCSDFPDQYEEYRKYIREKQMKEHSKKQKELTAAANAEKNRIDLAEMAVQSALSWNVGLNKARRESRKCSLDLQTFTIHVPKKQQKIEEDDRGNHYPVALIPGQYTDYYREYTPAELRYYPLNTVLYGPMKPNERKFDSQSEGSQSDSDSDSSSDDSSSSSSEGTQDTGASQSTMDDVDVELSRQKEDVKTINCKMCLKHLNKFSRTEVLIQCGTCNGYVHPSCIDLTLDMVPHIQAYAWQCTDCKTCAQCHDPADEDKMLFCDMCDRGYHIYCVGLRRVPQGRWHCQECAVCASCGSREAGGANSDRNSVAQWQHEYKKGDKNTRVYVSTLCVPCSKLWRKGRYCPHCSRCHTVQRLDLEANLVHCSACDKYLHLGCVETKDLTIDRKNYLCDFCQPLRQHMAKPLVSKVFRT